MLPAVGVQQAQGLLMHCACLQLQAAGERESQAVLHGQLVPVAQGQRCQVVQAETGGVEAHVPYVAGGEVPPEALECTHELPQAWAEAVTEGWSQQRPPQQGVPVADCPLTEWQQSSRKQKTHQVWIARECTWRAFEAEVVDLCLVVCRSAWLARLAKVPNPYKNKFQTSLKCHWQVEPLVVIQEVLASLTKN